MRWTTTQSKIVKCFTLLLFRGRKDKISTNIRAGTNVIIAWLHISLIQEPGSVYLGHVSLSAGFTDEIKRGIVNFFSVNNMSLKNLVFSGCDGTNVNTGRNKDVITVKEEEIGRSLQWLICQLHCNELPLRHLLKYLDGSATGPRAFSETIGKALLT